MFRARALPPVALPGGRFYQPSAGDRFFSRAPPSARPLPGQRIVDMAALTAAKRWFPLEAQPGASDLVPRRQKGALWLRERYGLVTGSALSKFLAWVHRRYDDDLECDEARLTLIYDARDEVLRASEVPYDPAVSGLKFEDDRDEAVGRERMQWGNDNEDNALATVLDFRPTLSLRECVLQRLPGARAQEPFGDSQDGAGVMMNGRFDERGMPLGTRVSAEFKCSYGHREPKNYRGVKDYYVPQCLFHMEVEESERCYFANWTPTTTRVWLVPRNTALFNEILDYVSAVLAVEDWTIEANGRRLLAEAERLRDACTAYAAACVELAGSPLPSCYASTCVAVPTQSESAAEQMEVE